MDDNGRQRRQEDLPMPAGYGYFQQPLQGQTSQQEQHQQRQQQQQQQQHQQHQQQQQQSRGWPTRATLGNVRNFRPSESGYGRANPGAPGMAASRQLSGSGVYGESPYYPEPASNAYAPSTMSQGTMGYAQTSSAGYGQQTTDPRQGPQGYSAGSHYPSSTMMYNVPQATSTPNSSMYDANPSFSSRQPAGLQVSPTDAASHFSYQNESPNVSAPTSGLRQEPTSSNAAHNVYQQPQIQNYSNVMPQITGMAPPQSATPDVGMEEQLSPAEEDPSRSFAHYESTLKETFRDIRNSSLVAASEHLLGASAELLDGIGRWGLTTDDPMPTRPDREQAWNDYNNAWLALLQRQKDMMESGQQLGRSQTLLSHETLEHLGKKLTEMCDKLEKYGLVDYQRGVWEERIIAILGECIDLFEAPGADDSGLAGSSMS